MSKRISRRQILGLGAATIAGGVSVWRKDSHAATRGSSVQYQSTATREDPETERHWEKSYSGGRVDVKPLPPGLPGKDYKPVSIPNGAVLPFKVMNGVKVFHLISEEVDHAFDSGLRAKCWGFNGRVNGTFIEAFEG